jgi:hypothetical protein
MKNEANSWICYDVKDIQIRVTHDSIRPAHPGNINHLRPWILEGSKNGLRWVKNDDRTNDTSLNWAGAISAFSISKHFEEEFRIIGLRQTGKNCDGNDYLIANAMGFFGILTERKHSTCISHFSEFDMRFRIVVSP